eukprot:TRINITY_DN114768_c0_g1_i1.p1 TRINITY_DN114768_c0_g1~~TRINITY_DN114768_c0_g1_i1.p1  ORF type:complete len:245 (-),score=33.95 TRINITY_DN114768_c0_g1_i1:35-769(-)
MGNMIRALLKASSKLIDGLTFGTGLSSAVWNLCSRIRGLSSKCSEDNTSPGSESVSKQLKRQLGGSTGRPGPGASDSASKSAMVKPVGLAPVSASKVTVVSAHLPQFASLLERLNCGTLVYLDTRTPEEVKWLGRPALPAYLRVTSHEKSPGRPAVSAQGFVKEVQRKLGKLETSNSSGVPLLVSCQSGVRSKIAAKWLRGVKGISELWELDEGYNWWMEQDSLPVTRELDEVEVHEEAKDDLF